ncbi:MAG: asparagine synthetase B family protein [Planctomycetaceae bacterium]|nr:asparagine synthetase B family protein [Planctomycetaceae bacterium]
MSNVPVERLINLLAPDRNLIFNMSVDEAIERVGSGDPAQVREIDGQFALLHREGRRIRMARSIGRPMRYFLAKQKDGPVLIVAERIAQIRAQLERDGLLDQFHPSYTRMVPAHHVTEISLVGCPDPNPLYHRFLISQRDTLPADIDVIGREYIQTVAAEIQSFIRSLPNDEPIGVLFSGGVDSGVVLLLTYHLLRLDGQSPARLKAFTLSVDGQGSDVQQAAEFLRAVGLDMLLEVVEVPASELDYRRAVQIIEDYKPLDVQAAVMTDALCRRIRQRYAGWKYLLDGDGGDENLRDYPIEENSELTIRSVLNNPFFYQEGWGVDKIKHSLTFSGGQSRGHVRSYAPSAAHGFTGFSPFATPNVIGVAEGIPFIELTQWQHDKLYQLKGQVAAAGIRAVTGMELPIFPKQRFQRGAVATEQFAKVFPPNELAYRNVFHEHFQVAAR